MAVTPGETVNTRSMQRMRSRQRLLEVAVERLAERGTSGTSVQDVAARAGLTSGAVYHQFSSREDLVRAASSYALSQHPRLEELSNTAGSVSEFLVTTAETAVRVLDDDQSGVRDLLRVQVHLLLAAAHDEDAREAITAFIGGQVEELADRIEAIAYAYGEQLATDPTDLAQEFLALVRGFLLLRIAAPALATDASILAAASRFASAATTQR